MNQMIKRITEDFFSEIINVDFGEDGQEWPNALWPHGSPFGGPGPHGDLFQFWGPHWVPISVPRSPFYLFRA